MFSARAAFDLRRNRFSLRLAELRRAGAPLLDLSESNPTRCGFIHPRPEALAPLADPRGLRYEPEAAGIPAAREAVAGYYAARGIALDPARIVLSASTSEAYAWLFKLLADPGDEVLAPRPSYPLFDYLAALEPVELRPYRLDPDHHFAIDLASLEDAITPRSRAVLVVSPNNPTGSVAATEELAALGELAGGRGLALICDEVFADYPFLPGGEAPVAAASSPAALTFSLSGLSKVCGLPQLKLGWMVVGGPETLVAEALARLELIADTYLSVATPVQLALPELLAAGRAFRAECLARVRANRALIADRLAHTPSVALLAAAGGWYACLRVPRLASEEELALGLLEDGVVAHPGYFFDFPGEAYLVVSLIVPPGVLAEGLARILARFA